ncbi:MAG: hypothetical protein R3294_07175, partial [Arenibacter troitsensis]|nr:hypothetical protein [Arenibacter troitsensis]
MRKHYLLILILFLLAGCATYKTKYAESSAVADITSNSELLHTFYLIGDAGKSPMDGQSEALEAFQKVLKKADKN